MKNTLNKILIIFIVAALAFSFNFISMADDAVIQIEEDISDEESKYVDDESDKPSKNYYSFSNENVTIQNEHIAGDVFIFTSGKVSIIDSTISGNIFIFAPEIETNNSMISTSSFLFAEKTTLNSLFDGNIYAFTKEFNFKEKAYTSLDLFLYAQDVNIDGSIGRDANIGAKNINISERAYIEGDLNKNTIEDNNDDVQKSNNLVDWIKSCLSYIILAIVLFMLYKYTKSRILEDNDNFTNNIGKYALYGILGLICTPIISIILLLLNITANAALLLIGLYVLLLFVSSITFVINLAIFVADKYADKIKIDNELLKTGIVIAVLSIAYKLLQLIPVIGFILTFSCTMFGLGMIMKPYLKKEN